MRYQTPVSVIETARASASEKPNPFFARRILVYTLQSYRSIRNIKVPVGVCSVASEFFRQSNNV
jgi:hypothetical protein